MAKIKSVKRKVKSLERLEDSWKEKVKGVFEDLSECVFELKDRLKSVIPKGYEFYGTSVGKYGNEYALFVHLRTKTIHPKNLRVYNDFSALNEGILKVLRDAEKELGIPVVYGARPSSPSVRLNY